MKETHLNTFMDILASEDKEKAVQFAIGLLESNEVNIETLYMELLAPSLTHFFCTEQDEDVCIWKEHTRTSIIRTILEISYLFILKTMPKKKAHAKKIMVLTPAFELHEIGAIMNTHFMLLEGLNATYIGANTPKQEILSAIRAYQPDYIALSVTNPYNLIVTKQTTEDIRRFFPDVKIVLGGQAFAHLDASLGISYDYLLHTFEDLKSFAKDVRTS